MIQILMSSDLSPLLLKIQLGLAAVSASLVTGALYGMSFRAEKITEDVIGRKDTGEEPRYREEMRREKRLVTNIFMEIVDASNQVAAVGRLLNMSFSGACIASAHILHKGDSVTVRMPTLHHGTNLLIGKVIWSERGRKAMIYGLQVVTSSRPS